jgi:probable phosphomutase (TIGR03848 family)
VLPGRAPGLHLSAKGREQADALATRMRELRRLTAVYTSPMERAQETADPVARAFQLVASVEPGLTECDYGEWTGRRLRDLYRKPEWKVVQRYPSGFRFPKGESFPEMQTRVATALGELVARHPGETIVAVSHGDPIRTAVALALGTPLDLFQRIVILPASITAVAYGVGGPRVLAVNSLGGDLAALVPR